MNGIVIINKPKGCTSHDVVYKVKKLFNEKVGHTGTLDPMAEGVLPVLVGKGTLLSKYLINHDKKYVVKLQLGIKTDTADSEGKIIEEKDMDLSIFNQEKLNEILKTFIGKQEQIPPIYSAIKVNGKKLYEYARKGQNVEIKPRQIEIYDINLINFSKEEKQIHYIAYCKHRLTNKWYKFNDSECEKASHHDIYKDSPYLLLYERIEKNSSWKF